MRTVKHSSFRELIADEGKRLTQSANVPDDERIFVTAVALGKGTRVDAWKEVDAPEPDGWEAPDVIEEE